jgi:hypothetical protein
MLNYLEQTTSSSSCKRMNSDIEIESPAPKRSMVSLTHLNEIKIENNRLKNQVEKYKNQCMRT